MSSEVLSYFKGSVLVLLIKSPSIVDPVAAGAGSDTSAGDLFISAHAIGGSSFGGRNVYR